MAVRRLHLYDSQGGAIAAGLRRILGEALSVTHVCTAYLERDNLNVVCTDTDSVWLDVKNHNALLGASVFVEMEEAERGIGLGCIEPSALHGGLISASQLLVRSERSNNRYSNHLRRTALLGPGWAISELKRGVWFVLGHAPLCQ